MICTAGCNSSLSGEQYIAAHTRTRTGIDSYIMFINDSAVQVCIISPAICSSLVYRYKRTLTGGSQALNIR